MGAYPMFALATGMYGGGDDDGEDPPEDPKPPKKDQGEGCLPLVLLVLAILIAAWALLAITSWAMDSDQSLTLFRVLANQARYVWGLLHRIV